MVSNHDKGTVMMIQSGIAIRAGKSHLQLVDEEIVLAVAPLDVGLESRLGCVTGVFSGGKGKVDAVEYPFPWLEVVQTSAGSRSG